MRHPATLRLSATNGFSKKNKNKKTIRDNVFVALAITLLLNVHRDT